MGRSRKTKRITWASDVNLCQVRLFLSEECPSQVGMGSQDHLQAKALWQAQTGDDNMPPGFGGIQSANLWTAKLSQIPLIKWKCPPRLTVNIDWRVVAGDESKETETQNEREMRVLEAIYPRSSAIPPNPSPFIGEQDPVNNDRYTPVVPITPIEDEDASSLESTVNNNTMISQAHGTSSSSSSQGTNDVVTAALTSVMSNNDQGGNMIDRDLLTKILSDPKMIHQLVTNHTSVKNVPSTHSNMPCTSGTQYNPSLSSPSNSSFVPPFPRPPGNLPFYPPNRIGSIPNLRPPPPVVSDVISAPPPLPPAVPMGGPPSTKDINYYKSLIQQHGGERREAMPPQFGQQNMPPQFGQQIQNNQEPANMVMMKPKVMKPCIYFNSSRGCRNGANCTYQHEMTSSSTSAQQRVGSIPEVQSSKRVKLDREITGT